MSSTRLKRKSSIRENAMTPKILRLQIRRLSVNWPCPAAKKSAMWRGSYASTKRKKKRGTMVKNSTWDGIL